MRRTICKLCSKSHSLHSYDEFDADTEVTNVSLNLNPKQDENMSIEMTMQTLEVKEEQGGNNTTIVGQYVCLLYVL